MKMNKRMISFLISTTLIFIHSPSVLAASVEADRKFEYVTKAEARTMAVENSNALRNLETSRQALLGQLADYNDQMEAYDQIYTLYQDYQDLLGKYKSTQADANKKAYFDYTLAIATNQQALGILAADLGTLTAELAAIQASATLEDPKSAEILAKQDEIAAMQAAIDLKNSEISAATASIALLLAPTGPLGTEQVAQIMTLTEYYTMVTYQGILSSAGITGSLSNREEYETFIYPIQVVPNTFTSGVQSLELGKEVAAVSIENGVIQLYNGLITLQNFEGLLTDSYDLSKEQVRQVIARLQVGKATQIDLDMAQNSEKTAALELQNMRRQIESMMLSFKQLVGLTYDTQIVLEEKNYTVAQFKTLQAYIDSALKNRNEFKSLKITLDGANYIMGYLDDYYDSDDYEYLIQDGEIELVEIDIEMQKAAIRHEITAAYQDVLEKQATYAYSQDDLQDAKDQRTRTQRYYDLGFITKLPLLQLDMLVVQKENAELSAYRDYIMALNQLESASQFGPAYSIQ